MRNGFEEEGDGGLSAVNFGVIGQDLVEKLWHYTIVQKSPSSSGHPFASCVFQLGAWPLWGSNIIKDGGGGF